MPTDYEDDEFFDDAAPRDETASDPKQRAADVLEQLRIHAELAAVFEGPRKFEHNLLGLDIDLAREIQQTVGKLEKSKQAKTGPILPAESVKPARDLLTLPKEQPRLTMRDYHVLRRPNEAMIVRWLAGEDVNTFYERYQAHLNVALEQRRDDERQELGWRSDEDDQAYLEALDEAEPDPAVFYLREPIRKHGLYVLSTLAVDEMDILHLADTLMGLPAADVVGSASAPDPDEESPPESERAWYFKLFALRATVAKEERMCFFAYLQRASDDVW
jgi:hypothetical protein